MNCDRSVEILDVENCLSSEADRSLPMSDFVEILALIDDRSDLIVDFEMVDLVDRNFERIDWDDMTVHCHNHCCFEVVAVHSCTSWVKDYVLFR